MQQTPQSQPSLPLWKHLLEYYSIQSIDELILIMLNPAESAVYHEVRNNPAPAIDLQKFTTIKSSVQYKRQLLLYLFKERIQMDGKKDKQKAKEKDKDRERERERERERQKDISFGDLLTPKKKPRTPTHNHNLQISHHSYQQLQTYFTTNKDASLCKQILKLKYQRGDIMQSHKIRKYFWLQLIGYQQKLEQYHGLYQILSEYQDYPEFFQKIIHADVVRTVHDVDQGVRKDLVERMQRILRNYSIRNPYIGYCQGMNFLLHFLLTMNFTQPESFYLLLTLLQQKLPLSYYTNMSSIATDIRILHTILSHFYPKIMQKLQSLSIDISIFMLQWLVCIFTTILPFYVCKYLWIFVVVGSCMGSCYY